jgi:hypothetical protein
MTARLWGCLAARENSRAALASLHSDSQTGSACKRASPPTAKSLNHRSLWRHT